MFISDRPVWDITPERVPFSSAKIFCNVSCRFPQLELELSVCKVCSKSLACLKDLLFGTDDIIIIDNSHNAASKGVSLLLRFWNALLHAIAKNQLLSTAPCCMTSSILNGAFVRCMPLPVPSYEE
jgi:hypothetical protein